MVKRGGIREGREGQDARDAADAHLLATRHQRRPRVLVLQRDVLAAAGQRHGD
jgi:hypothetical protein